MEFLSKAFEVLAATIAILVIAGGAVALFAVVFVFSGPTSPIILL